MPTDPILHVIEAALGERPADFVKSGRSLTSADVERMIGAWHSLEPITKGRQPAQHEIWPLVSHHVFDGHTLFTGDAGRTMLPRVLNILLLHDGLVVADPFADVARLLAHDHVNEALALTTDVVQGAAPCEGLLDRGVMRFTSQRPALADDARRAVLGAFNVDPDMQVFTNFIEAAVTVETMPGLFESEYRPQVLELFDRFGLEAPMANTLPQALTGLRALAAALIEVSWQMAICATDATCDLALVSPLERRLADLVIEAAASPGITGSGAGSGRTRHIARLAAGDLPNLDPAELSIADAVSIRESDAFAEFRQLLRGALDTFDNGLRTGQTESDARAVFEDQMRDGVYALTHRVGKASFKDRLRDTSVPLAIGAASAGLLAPLGPEFSALGGSVAALSGTVWQWLTGRRSPAGFEVARRYVSMLGGERRP